MDILCSLAYFDPPCDRLKDHIDLLVKKQVSSNIRSVKNRGIIGVIRVIDHLIWDDRENDASDLNSSYNSVRDLPSPRSQLAADYIGK